MLIQESLDAVALMLVDAGLPGDRDDGRSCGFVEEQLAHLAVGVATHDVADLSLTAALERRELLPLDAAGSGAKQVVHTLLRGGAIRLHLLVAVSQ